MMRMPQFDYYAPDSMPEALKVLAQRNGDVKIVAGGTDLLVGLKQGVSVPRHVVWLGKLTELQRITLSPEQGLRIGAMCTLRDVERNTHVQESFPSLVPALRSVASPQVRNQATVGGNLCLNTRCFYYDQSGFWRTSIGYCLKYGDGLCHAAPELNTCGAVFSSDLAPLLIALGATVTLNDVHTERSIPLSRLYVNDGKSHLAMRNNELLTSIAIPYDPNVRACHLKYRIRESIDFPLVNVGVAVAFSDRSRCVRASIVIGAVSSAPLIAADAGEYLVGEELTPERITGAADRVLRYVRPLPNIDSPVGLRRKMAAILVKKALTRIAGET